VKDLTVARENPDVSSNDLLNKNQKIGRSLAQKDMANPPKCLEHPSSEDSEDIDFWGHVNTTYFALEHLQRRRGQIVVTSSMTAFLPFPFTTVYSAAKGALFNFFETLRIELLSKSVTVTIASPGFIQSELTSREWPGKLPWWFPMARTEDAAREQDDKHNLDKHLPDDKHLQNNRSDKKNECKKCRTEKLTQEKNANSRKTSNFTRSICPNGSEFQKNKTSVLLPGGLIR